MDIVPITTKDNLSKEQIEHLQKQQTEYKLVNKIKKNPGHILFSFNRKTKEIKRASILDTKIQLIRHLFPYNTTYFAEGHIL